MADTHGQPAGGSRRDAQMRGRSISVQVDGIAVSVSEEASLLDACDAAGRYVPRLCHHPGLGERAPDRNGRSVGASTVRDDDPQRCGLCLVRVEGERGVLACSTPAIAHATVSTDDPGLREARRQRLAAFLARHPHACLTCPERDGCSRDECTYGNPPETRCCDEFGRCEFGKVVGFIDPECMLPRRAIRACRSAAVEGPIRREPGLCLGCGRCVEVCNSSEKAGQALELVLWPGTHGSSLVDRVSDVGAWPVANPKGRSLRESGCTFCGLCVAVCPTGALTAPGSAGARWLAERREGHGVARQVLPPEGRRSYLPGELRVVPDEAGVFTILDGSGEVLRIAGVADLRRGLAEAISELGGAEAAAFLFEVDPLYTQRETELLGRYLSEHGRLPLGNDLADDLFGDGPSPQE
jgi:ferredoxin